MESNDWAQFSTTGTTEAKEEQNDDWGDFGGFETAQPVTDPGACNTSGVISWATTFTTQASPAEQHSTHNVSVSPNLRQGTHLAAVLSETTAVDPVLETVKQVQNSPNLSSAPLSNNSRTSKSDPQQQADINTSSNDKSTATSDKQQATQIPVTSKNDGSSLHEHIEEAHKSAEVLNVLEGKLSLAEQENFELKEELESLLTKHQELENLSKTTHENVEEQKRKYAKCQIEHHQQLQDIRQAGHDALAMIVEEYKELSKQAVLEEREKTQAQLHNFLEDERRKFQEILSQQQESFETTLAEEREKNNERVKAVIEVEHHKRKLAIESALNKERDEFKGKLEMAIKETREQGEEAVKAAVSKEKEIHLAFMEKMEKTMNEEREKFRTSMREVQDNERRESKKAIQEAMAEERTKSRETVNKSVEETKTLMNEYIKQKQQVDTQSQQKQFIVMDLFLESARTQLKNLMDSNQKS